MPSTWTSPSERDGQGAAGRFYDGLSSQSHPVTVHVEGGHCRIEGDGIRRAAPLRDVAISEPLGGAQRIIRFRDGASCEVAESERLSAMLCAAGVRDSFAVRLQRRWRWSLASFVLLVAFLFAAYWWGLPWAAGKLAFRLPQAALRAVSQHALSNLDKSVLQPSTLSSERRVALHERFSKVLFPRAMHVPLSVEFRNSEYFGPNAFALPDGTVIFMDALVSIAEDDDQLVAVLAHEAGHVTERHGLRQMIQSSVVAAFLAAYVGDVSALGGAFAGLLLETKYSRGFERDADRYAASVLRHNGLSPRLMARVLSLLEETRGKGHGASDGVRGWDYLSTHPPTAERVRELESLPR